MNLKEITAKIKWGPLLQRAMAKFESKKLLAFATATVLLCFGVIDQYIWAGLTTVFMGAEVWQKKYTNGGTTKAGK